MGILQHIGRRPLAAVGNWDGDLQMLEWTAAGGGERFCLYVHHTDADRESACRGRRRTSANLTKDSTKARVKGWTVVDVEQAATVDWPTSRCSPTASIHDARLSGFRFQPRGGVGTLDRMVEGRRDARFREEKQRIVALACGYKETLLAPESATSSQPTLPAAVPSNGPAQQSRQWIYGLMNAQNSESRSPINSRAPPASRRLRDRAAPRDWITAHRGSLAGPRKRNAGVSCVAGGGGGPRGPPRRTPQAQRAIGESRMHLPTHNGRRSTASAA